MMRAFDSLHSLVHHNLAATIAVMIAYSLGVLVGLGCAFTPIASARVLDELDVSSDER